MQVSTFRDLTVLQGQDRLVIACDSVGGIGPKPADTFPVAAADTAHFATRVPLLEVLCVGATPLVVIDALCVEMDGIGAEMIAAVRALVAQVGVAPQAVNGSTEDNVVTQATGIGVTVVASLPAQVQLAPKSGPGDAVVCVGLPLSAPDHALYPGHPGQVSVAEVQALVGSGRVHDAIAVGSHGVEYEVGQLLGPRHLAWTDTSIDRVGSGGPSSCVLISCASADLPHLRALVAPDRPWTVLGRVQ